MIQNPYWMFIKSPHVSPDIPSQLNRRWNDKSKLSIKFWLDVILWDHIDQSRRTFFRFPVWFYFSKWSSDFGIANKLNCGSFYTPKIISHCNKWIRNKSLLNLKKNRENRRINGSNLKMKYPFNVSPTYLAGGTKDGLFQILIINFWSDEKAPRWIVLEYRQPGKRNTADRTCKRPSIIQ